MFLLGGEFEVSLENIYLAPFEEDKDIQSLDDVMYFYYDLKVKLRDKEFVFEAHDFPVVQYFKELFNDVKENESDNITLIQPPTFGMEHGIGVSKFKAGSDSILYSISIFEEMGSSTFIDYVCKSEVEGFIKYIDNKINEAIQRFNNGEMYEGDDIND